MQQANLHNKKTKAKARKIDSVKKKLHKKERSKGKAESFNFSALHLLNDPQGNCAGFRNTAIEIVLTCPATRFLRETVLQAICKGRSLGSAFDETEPHHPYHWCTPVDLAGLIPILDQIPAAISTRCNNGIGQRCTSYACFGPTGCA